MEAWWKIASFLLLGMVAAVQHAADEDGSYDENGCKGGTCPMPSSMISSDGAGANGPTSGISNDCGLWMGPSPIKNAEEHGFGLGLFTGRAIPVGTPIEPTFFGHGEILLPIYAHEQIFDDHPPLREYIWDEDNMPEVAVEYPDLQTALFIPGLAAIAPCTAQNYNLELIGRGTDYDKPRWSAMSDDGGVHRATHPQAGAFSYRHNVTYVAVRDIAPGEELTVRCSDSNFDGGAYYLSRYNSQDNSVVCLDQNLRVAPTSSDEAKGLGVFAKRNLKKEAILTSTPLVPVHRTEMDVEDEAINEKNLMLNYLFGHPDSDLLLLPFGPMVNFINHNQQQPNAVIQWHTVKDDHQSEGSLDRREVYHHPEMLHVPADTVVKAHGKGLMMDIVALRDIQGGGEIFLDYGSTWQEAWDAHRAEFESIKRKLSETDISYISAEREIALIEDEPYYRTLSEQGTEPYPDNLQFYCFYEQHDDENQDDPKDSYRRTQGLSRGGFQHFSWFDHEDHPCMRPCTIVQRYQDEDEDEPRYSVEMFKNDNPHVMYYCTISKDYFYKDVPESDIRLLDKPYTTDVFRREAFRQAIGVPEGFYPDAWMRKKLRQRGSMIDMIADGEKFKRKPAKKEKEIAAAMA